MSDDTDARLLTGQLILRTGAVSADQLIECLEEEGELRIGDRLVDRDLMSRGEVERLIGERDASKLDLEDTVLGELAVRNGFLTREELEECLAEQEDSRASTGTPPRLGEIMKSHDFVHSCDVEALLARQTSLLQEILDDDADEETEDSSEEPAEGVADDNIGEEDAADAQDCDDIDAAAEGGASARQTYQRLFQERVAALLFPAKGEPICCPSCASSANSALAVVCSGCGSPLRVTTGAGRYNPWLLRGGFVVLAGLTGVFSLTEGPYIIAALMFMLLGAAMLRSYRPARQFFLVASLILFGAIYWGVLVLHVTGDQVVQAAQNPVYWRAWCGGISAALAMLTLSVSQPFGVRKTVGWGGACLVFGALLGGGVFAGSWAMARSFPMWAALCVGAATLTLAVLITVRMFVDGMTVETRRPGVIVEATRPFRMADRPSKAQRDWPELPALARPLYLTLDGVIWSARMSAYYMVCGVLRFSNEFAYCTQFGMDLLFRSLVRAWRRLVELTKALGGAVTETLAFAGMAGSRLFMVIVFPLAILIVSSLVGVALAQAAVAYMRAGELSNLGTLAAHAAILYVSCGVVVGLLARCHSARVVVKEAFQALSFHVPTFLMLVLATSIVLSIFRWATGIGPFRFGPLSVVLGFLVIVLFGVIVLKGKKTSKATESSSAKG